MRVPVDDLLHSISFDELNLLNRLLVLLFVNMMSDDHLVVPFGLSEVQAILKSTVTLKELVGGVLVEF